MSAGDSVRGARIARGLSQVELARHAKISRQALGAIESGAYQPGVTVALNLARALGQSVESLFGAEADDTSRHVAAGWRKDRARDVPSLKRVALGRVGGKLVAIAQTAARLTFLPGAGMLERATAHRAEVSTFLSEQEIDSTLLIAGCDPAAAILKDWLARERSPVTAISLACSSNQALANVLDGRVHVAGVHLRDAKNAEYNLGPVRRALGRRQAVIVRFALWELGFAIRAGNSERIRSFNDLARPKLRIANREPGSGARATLDEELARLRLNPRRIAGYGNELGGHLEVAAAIADGQADTGLTIRVAADVFGLGFIPVREERYDLVILAREMNSAPIVAMMEALNARRFAGEVDQLCGYDTAQMGQVAAHIN